MSSSWDYYQQYNRKLCCETCINIGLPFEHDVINCPLNNKSQEEIKGIVLAARGWEDHD